MAAAELSALRYSHGNNNSLSLQKGGAERGGLRSTRVASGARRGVGASSSRPAAAERDGKSHSKASAHTTHTTHTSWNDQSPGNPERAAKVPTSKLREWRGSTQNLAQVGPTVLRKSTFGLGVGSAPTQRFRSFIFSSRSRKKVFGGD